MAKFTEQDREFILANLETMPNKEIAAAIGRSVNSLQKYMHKNRIIRSREATMAMRSLSCRRTFGRWRDEDLEFLRKNYAVMTRNKLASVLGVSRASVDNALHRYDIRISRETAQQRIAENRFRAGNIPWNRGMKGLRFSRQTEFKKGNLPANTLYDGCITVRSEKGGRNSLYIRTEKGKWESYARYIWRLNAGEIPAGKMVGFVNDDPMDCRFENLFLLTRAQNVRRNHNPIKAAVTMRKNWDRRLDKKSFLAALIFPREKNLRVFVENDEKLLQLKKQHIILRRRLNEYRTKSTGDER